MQKPRPILWIDEADKQKIWVMDRHPSNSQNRVRIYLWLEYHMSLRHEDFNYSYKGNFGVIYDQRY